MQGDSSCERIDSKVSLQGDSSCERTDSKVSMQCDSSCEKTDSKMYFVVPMQGSFSFEILVPEFIDPSVLQLGED
jgi:hypothetical protein